MTDDGVAAPQGPGIVTKAYQLGQPRHLFKIIDMTDVIQVDDRIQLMGLLVFFRWRIIRCKHDALTRHTSALGKDKLSH